MRHSLHGFAVFAILLLAACQAPDPQTPTPIHTAAPTRRATTPTLIPLSEAAVDSCPVSTPNLTESPAEYYMPVETGFSNPEQTLFISLYPQGRVIFFPGGPGEIHSDGSMGMKFWFYRDVAGEVILTGQRLDEPGEVAQLDVLRTNDGYGEIGFHPASLRFPSQGCWEVTATSGDQSMTFVTLVLWSLEKPSDWGW